MLSDRGLPDFPRLYRSVRCCLLLVQKHRPVPTFNYFPAQSLHFRYGSAAPYPTLRADVTTLLPRTRYGRLATPYPTGLPCCVLPAYKDCSRSQWKTACAVFSVRTATSIIKHRTYLKNAPITPEMPRNAGIKLTTWLSSLNISAI